jgi:ferredoxin-thioredoxin reductase catalytic chain
MGYAVNLKLHSKDNRKLKIVQAFISNMEEKEIQDLKKESKEYADSVGIKLNPNEKITEAIIKGLLKNKELKGDLYCPCRIVSGNKEKDREIVCPCVFHRGEIELQGKCHCQLFVKGD